jgi:hypothetical protein
MCCTKTELSLYEASRLTILLSRLAGHLHTQQQPAHGLLSALHQQLLQVVSPQPVLAPPRPTTPPSPAHNPPCAPYTAPALQTHNHVEVGAVLSTGEVGVEMPILGIMDGIQSLPLLAEQLV